MRVTEEWRVVPGTNGWYEVSDLGRVRTYHLAGSKIGTRSEQPRVLKGFLRNGYPHTHMSFEDKPSRGYATHAIVALTFLGPRAPDKQVCHNDGNPLNNSLSNLRYDTYSGNQMDRLAHGTDNRGVKHGANKLTEDEVREIRRLCAEPGSNHSAIGRQFGVRRDYARQIHIRRVWKWLV